MEYWLGGIDSKSSGAELAPSVEELQKWFGPSREVDKHIRANFGSDFKKLDRGLYRTWTEDHDGRLAAIILYDQFARSLFRKTPKAYAYGKRAERIAQRAIALDVVKEYRYMAQCFLLLPLVHAESRELGNLAVAEMENVKKRVKFDSASIAQGFNFNLYVRAARKNNETIQKFGRDPHRNAVLKRESTPAELEYLEAAEKEEKEQKLNV